ncbi:NRDE family protein [Marinactinospora thermotolerans]|uniref:Uncharacterized conserved protein n=1 Tax=Marinactinospora thermotolerans DSM 45154 TaxID=1122192 RepID=A0A1T4T6K0_9ACTN|nr:NRDE family protein [Marinactinospora thermotolerans]SKA36086.1 Uncharacterized conserved protein [Marinactinospora thermotolerans DSM 45154]
MCTVVVFHDPAAPVPLLIAAVRDEMTDRPWLPPARHWPRLPEVVGGRDLRAGGTWLAVAPGAVPRVGAVLNGFPEVTPRMERAPAEEGGPAGRSSRGELPLSAAAHGAVPDAAEAARFDPFHLLRADPAEAVLYSWDGARLLGRRLPPGVHVLVNSGWDPEAPRARRHAPLFTAALPRTGAGELRAASRPEEIWGGWLSLVNEAAAGPARGAGEEGGDSSALFARMDLPGGRAWASTSVTLLAVAPGVVRYAFNGSPGDPGAWYMVG